MEYLTELVTMVPEGTSLVKVDELRTAEAYDHMMSGKARFRCVLTTGN
jgi:hypothetical protein